MHKPLRPYHLLLAGGLLTAFLSLLCKAATIDIHIHDTYYVIGTKFILLAPSVLLLFLWLLYTGVSGILLSNKLTWLHIIITTVTIALIMPIALWVGFAGNYTFRHFPMLNDIMAVSFLLFISGQLLFVVNLVGGIVSRLRNNNFSKYVDK